MVRKGIQEEKVYIYGKFFIIKNYTFSFYLYICAHACVGVCKFGHVNAMHTCGVQRTTYKKELILSSCHVSPGSLTQSSESNTVSY